MPKIVDTEKRREAIADATLAVIVRDGADHASLRNVAAEAGLAVGSVRHYFASQADVISFAMRRLADRVGARVLAAAEPVFAADDRASHDIEARRRVSESALGQLLPIDAERRREAEAWLALTAASRTRPDLQPIARKFYDGTRAIARRVLAGAQQHGHLPPGPEELELEAERLTALLDGLATNAVLHPDGLHPEIMKAVLRRHLESLTEQATETT